MKKKGQQTQRIGFLGVGYMGGPMAANLLAAGHGLTVWNRTRSKTAPLKGLGARVADTPCELAERCDIVLSCLATVAASREVFLGSDGLVESAREGQILVDHGTVDIATSRECHAAFAARGAAFLDAPVSGGPQGATDGTLSIMVGGELPAFESTWPLFEAMGTTIVHMGPSGAGTATKLANQLLVGVHTTASCEALLLARRAGVDSGKLMQVLANSWGASRMLDRNAPVILSEDFGMTGAPLRNLLKDLSIVTALGRELEVPLPSASAAERVYSELVDAGEGEADITAAYRHLAGEV